VFGARIPGGGGFVWNVGVGLVRLAGEEAGDGDVFVEEPPKPFGDLNDFLLSIYISVLTLSYMTT
jgi:hypothetical protein